MDLLLDREEPTSLDGLVERPLHQLAVQEAGLLRHRVRDPGAEGTLVCHLVECVEVLLNKGYCRSDVLLVVVYEARKTG